MSGELHGEVYYPSPEVIANANIQNIRPAVRMGERASPRILGAARKRIRMVFQMGQCAG